MDLSEDINIAELFDLTDDLPNVDLIEGNDELLNLVAEDRLEDVDNFGSVTAPQNALPEQLPPLFDWPHRHEFAVPTVKTVENGVIPRQTKTSVVPLNVASSVTLSRARKNTPQPCAPCPSVVLCRPSSSSEPYTCTAFMASPDAFIAPHDSTLLTAPQAVPLSSDRVLEVSQVAVSEPAPAFSVVKQAVPSSSSIFFEPNLSSSNSVQQQIFPSCSTDSTFFVTDHSFDFIANHSFDSNSPSSPCASASQIICSTSANHLPSYASLQPLQRHHVENSSPLFHSSVNPEQTSGTCADTSAVYGFLDNIIEETREEIRQYRKLEERSSPAPFDLSPKRRRMFSENCTTADKEASCPQQNETSDQSSRLHDCIINKQDNDMPSNTRKSSGCNSIDSDQGYASVSQFGTSYSVSSGSPAESITSHSSGSLDSSPSSHRSAISLAGLSDEEIAKRKREQNRIAAARYRKKKRTNIESDRLEIERLEKRNAYLKMSVEMLTKEINKYKGIILEGVRKDNIGNSETF